MLADIKWSLNRLSPASKKNLWVRLRIQLMRCEEGCDPTAVCIKLTAGCRACSAVRGSQHSSPRGPISSTSALKSERRYFGLIFARRRPDPFQSKSPAFSSQRSIASPLPGAVWRGEDPFTSCDGAVAGGAPGASRWGSLQSDVVRSARWTAPSRRAADPRARRAGGG